MTVFRLRSNLLTTAFWLMTSVSAALVCHAVITLIVYPHLHCYSNAMLPDAVVAPPRMLGIIGIICGYLAVANAKAMARDYGGAGCEYLMHAATAASSGLTAGAVAILATSAFLFIDGIAQIFAFGHLTGLSDVLGGNILGGLSLIMLVAIAITLMVRGLAAWCMADFVTILAEALTWLLETMTAPAVHASFRSLRRAPRLRAVESALSGGGALRAPPVRFLLTQHRY